MEGGIEKRLQRVEDHADDKALVMSAANHAAQDLLNLGIDAEVIGEAKKAMEEIVVNYESAGKRAEAADLQNMAYDAFEEVLRKAGYTQPEFAQRFLEKMKMQLGHTAA